MSWIGTGTPITAPITSGPLTLVSIRQAVTDQLTTETIAVATLDRLIAAAVRFYSRYNPAWKYANITTVANQQLYDLPTDCMIVIGLNYWPGEMNAGLVNAGYEWPTNDITGEEYDQISLRVIAEIKRGEANRRSGFWRQDGIQLYLSPIPGTAGETIPLVYGALHALDGTGTTYTTIPIQDLEIVRDLTLAEYLEGRRVEFALEPDYAEGLGRIIKHYQPGSLQSVVKDLRSHCINKYSQVVVGT